MKSLDVARLRGETKGCERVIHFNNAGASLPPDEVHHAVVGYLEQERLIGGYETAAMYGEVLESFYGHFARLLNCQTHEIAFVENATRAWDMAFYSIPLGRGDRIITAKAEYVSNFLAYLQVARDKGVTIDVVPNDVTGQLDTGALESMIDERVKLIAMTHVPTQGGLVNPAVEVGSIARKHDILYLLDGCQSVGQMPIDVNQIGCDMLSGTGRKYLRGPRGTGFLYVRGHRIQALSPPFIDLHAARWTAKNQFEIRTDARRFENWECFFAGKVGLAKAVEYALSIGLESIYRRIQQLAHYLRESIESIPGFHVHDLGREKCGIVTFAHDVLPVSSIQASLARHQMNISIASVTNARLDFEDRSLQELARASVHYFNTEQEVNRFCEQLNGLTVHQ